MISYKIIPVVEMQIKTFVKMVDSPLPTRKGRFRKGSSEFTIVDCSNPEISPFLIANVQHIPEPGDTFTFEYKNGLREKVVIIKDKNKTDKNKTKNNSLPLF